jgi:beta-galactosidase
MKLHLRPFFIALTFCAGLAVARAETNSPREKLLMDFGWKFHLGDAPDVGNKFDYPEVSDLAKTHVDEIGLEGELATNLPDSAAGNLGGDVSFVQPKFNDKSWRKLDLPHDWVVELPFDEKADLKHGFKPVGADFPENSIGWYRRKFDLPASDKGKTLWLEFDGVYRDSLVWLNGHCLGRHVSGYSGFRYDITRFANYGGKNELVVRADATRFEGWFYEGAGIYRHVWLEKTAPLAIAPDGVFVWSEFTNNVPEGLAKIHIQTRLLNHGKPISGTSDIKINSDIFTPEGQKIAFAFVKNLAKFSTEYSHENSTLIDLPELWSPESPKLYKLITTVESGGQIVDRKETEFGIRTVAFDATNGFLLNGKPYEIKGTCNHQDHAGVGSAMPDALQYFRVAKLKEMGCNAIRTSHNPPTPELLEACDRLGMLVMDETRRMDTNDFALGELKNLILRDRNHPSVFIWSLGNEEMYLQGTRTNAGITPAVAHDAAIRVITPMQNLAHELDPTRLCTVAMNGGWGDGFSKVIDVQGFNYHTANIDKFRAAHPAQLTIGTETASTRVTRGIYADDKVNGYVAAYGSNGVERAQQWWPYYATHPFTSGGFVWTGFDYRGEPTPYKWPCISSHFGLMDTCGFPKDIYYYYQSWWTDKPVLHIMPHWNWPGREGQPIDVRCFSNCKEVELFLNGKSLGKKTMSSNWFLDWNVNYEPGVLSAKGYDGDKLVAETEIETTGAPASIQLTPDRSAINADGEDLSIITVSVTDAQGRTVPLADNLIHFKLSGPGKIIGVGNGDPSSHEADKAKERKVFCGLAQVIVQSTKTSGKIKLTAITDNLPSATVAVSSQACTPRLAVP